MEFAYNNTNYMNSRSSIITAEELKKIDGSKIIANYNVGYTYGGTIKINDNKEDDRFMYNSLFNINVVTTKGEIIIEDEKAIANTEEEAKFNAGVYENLRDNGLTFDDVTIKINNLGSIKLEKPETEME